MALLASLVHLTVRPMRDTYFSIPDDCPYKAPERALLLAILDRAIRDLLLEREKRSSAVRWFKAKAIRSRRGSFTFIQVVEYLSDVIGENELKYLGGIVEKAIRGTIQKEDIINLVETIEGTYVLRRCR